MAENGHTATSPHGGATDVQSMTTGGSKPLYRFIRGQPKIIGVIVSMLGLSFITVTFAINPFLTHPYASTAGYWMGTLYTICGILYILTEHNPSKKMVTICLAASIVGVLVNAFHGFLILIPKLISYENYQGVYGNETTVEELPSYIQAEKMELVIFSTFLFYNFVVLVIYIVMSVISSRALRSTKTQAVVIMSALMASDITAS